VEPSRALPVDPTRERRLVKSPRRAVYREPVVREVNAPEPAPAPLIEDPELDAMRAADQARDEGLRTFNARGKRRLKMYILASVVFFPLVACVLTPAGLNTLWFTVLVAAAYGAFVALARPGMLLCSVATVLTGLLIQSVHGAPSSSAEGFAFTLALFLYGTAGLFVGYTEQRRQLDR